jgi:Na+/H+ antiporter NhaD/arsenite permease-like protein
MKNILIFCITYSGIALGGIPGLAVDRTGIALLGSIAMVVSGAVAPSDALLAVDFSTILLLFGLMILSAQFRLGGFYSYAAQRISESLSSPRRFLLLLMTVSAVLSALLANDIVCLAFTPVITVALMKQNRNPVPYLIALAVSANIGSAATIIGNPQNMLIGQTGSLSFGRFALWCFPPVLAGLAASYLVIRRIFRTQFNEPHFVSGSEKSLLDDHSQSFSRWQSGKGAVILCAVIILFFLPVPREVTVLAAAGLLLCSRTIKSVELLGLVDWQLITLFCGLFIVIKGISVTGIPLQFVSFLTSSGINIHNGYILSAISLVMSNIVSNVPAVMLIVPHCIKGNPVEWYILALSSTFAGNLITIGSLANLITFQIAETYGVKISFREHAQVGIPVTLASMAILFLWIAIAG